MLKPKWMSELDFDALGMYCLEKANVLKEKQVYVSLEELDIFEIAELLIKLEIEKLEKNRITDMGLNYNDEILSIEEAGDLETVDISVSGDNLFYCNGILTKNSFGLPATADLMFAIIRTEELDELNQVMIKQLKNRYNDPSYYKRFVLGIDRAKMKLYDAEPSAQKNISDSGQEDDKPLFDKSKIGERTSDSNYSGFKF